MQILGFCIKNTWWKRQNVFTVSPYYNSQMVSPKFISLVLLCLSDMPFFKGQPYCLATVFNIIFTFSQIVDAFI